MAQSYIVEIVMGANRAFCLYLYLRAGRSLLADGIPAQRYCSQLSDAVRSDAQDTATVTAKLHRKLCLAHLNQDNA
ncbi:hypothetical protein [Psychrobacter sp. P11G5]|uniref:hypothetical protein n=1 Tax=Psychrobacter sp. P11G5 TaxID=1699624 RepID=UPI00078C10A2|nr:hypothetical protein [Psychrobacter sp. P11G5]AMN66356.1 hypothetical protein AK825_00280 [Psychrobacter sp. P11G5]